MDSLSDIAYEYFVEFETEKSCPHHFEGDPSILLFFQSWAFSVQFGGQHDLAKIAFHLKQSLKIKFVNTSPDVFETVKNLSLTHFDYHYIFVFPSHP